MGSKDFWNRTLGGGALVWGAAPSPAVGLLAEHVPAPARVIVPGCGYGRNALALAALGYEVVATDGSKAGLRRARAEFAHPGIQYIEQDLFDTPTGRFDAILAHYVLHLFLADERARLLRLWKAALRPGGLVLVTALSTGCPFFGKGDELEPGTWSNPGWIPIHFETAAELTTQLSAAGFTVLSAADRLEPEDKPAGLTQTPTVYGLARA